MTALVLRCSPAFAFRKRAFTAPGRSGFLVSFICDTLFCSGIEFVKFESPRPDLSALGPSNVVLSKRMEHARAQVSLQYHSSWGPHTSACKEPGACGFGYLIASILLIINNILSLLYCSSCSSGAARAAAERSRSGKPGYREARWE